jgi:hypothetical protein
MPEKPQQIALFCDEAGTAGDRFLAVGGLIVSSTDAPVIRRKFEWYRRTHNGAKLHRLEPQVTAFEGLVVRSASPCGQAGRDQRFAATNHGIKI